MSRYVVTELEGYAGPRESAGPFGLSCHVIDTRWNHRLVASFRTEDYRYRGEGRTGVRRRAKELAERLNAG